MSELPSSSEFAFVISRSKFLDAYANVEEAVRSRMTKLGLTPGGLLGQSLELLEKAKPSPLYSKAEHKAVQDAIFQIKPLHKLRCDIVHGRMEIVEMGGRKFACFANPQKRQAFSSVASLISESQFDELIATLDKLTRALTPVSPASSPRPPLQGAAGGP